MLIGGMVRNASGICPRCERPVSGDALRVADTGEVVHLYGCAPAYPTNVIPTTDARGELTGRFVIRCSCGWKFDGPGPDGLEYRDANAARVAHGGGHFEEAPRLGIPGMSSAW